MKSTIRVLAFGAICLLCVGLWLDGKQAKQHTCPEPQIQTLPSIIDIQTQVGATPDGKLGPDTQEKWDSAYFNQCAAKVWPKEKP